MQHRANALGPMLVIGLASAFLAGAIMPASAVPVLTGDAAVATVVASGFSRVARTEAYPRQGGAPDTSKPAAWDVWASKDGITYEITIDADTGQVLTATPAVADD